MDRRTDGQTDARTDARASGRMDGQIDRNKIEKYRNFLPRGDLTSKFPSNVFERSRSTTFIVESAFIFFAKKSYLNCENVVSHVLMGKAFLEKKF